MWHFIAGFLVGAPVWVPAGMWCWWKYGFGLKSDSQKVRENVTGFTGKVSSK